MSRRTGKICFHQNARPLLKLWGETVWTLLMLLHLLALISSHLIWTEMDSGPCSLQLSLLRWDEWRERSFSVNESTYVPAVGGRARSKLTFAWRPSKDVDAEVFRRPVALAATACDLDNWRTVDQRPATDRPDKYRDGRTDWRVSFTRCLSTRLDKCYYVLEVKSSGRMSSGGPSSDGRYVVGRWDGESFDPRFFHSHTATGWLRTAIHFCLRLRSVAGVRSSPASTRSHVHHGPSTLQLLCLVYTPASCLLAAKINWHRNGYRAHQWLKRPWSKNVITISKTRPTK